MFPGIEHGSLVQAQGCLQLFVRIDQAFHRVVVRRGVFGGHVTLHAAAGARATVCEFLDQIIVQDLARRCVGNDLLEKFGRGPGFLQAARQLDGVRQLATLVLTREVVLGMGVCIRRRCKRRRISCLLHQRWLWLPTLSR